MNGNIERLQKTDHVHGSFESFRAQYLFQGIAPQVLRREYDKLNATTIYASSEYTVLVDKNPQHGFAGCIVWHLSIRRTDREPVMDWRDMQAIKNQLCGEECEAFQLFPAESRVMDTANQYHLFALMKDGSSRLPRLPIGWTIGQKCDHGLAKSKQRPHAQNGERQTP